MNAGQEDQQISHIPGNQKYMDVVNESDIAKCSPNEQLTWFASWAAAASNRGANKSSGGMYMNEPRLPGCY